MKELGFITALVLILCGITYLSRSSATGSEAANTKYESAIGAAKAVKGIADADTRRRWVLNLQLTANEIPDTAYSADGENSEILVLTSDSADSRSCSNFANSDHASAAAIIGFTEVSCRNRSTGAVYKMPITIAP